MSIYDPFGPVHFLRLRGALRIEVKTGMKHSKGSTMNYIRSLEYVHPVTGQPTAISTKRTKKAVLYDLEVFMKVIMGMDIEYTDIPIPTR